MARCSVKNNPEVLVTHDKAEQGINIGKWTMLIQRSRVINEVRSLDIGPGGNDATQV
jgi:hypothetical protein